MRTSIKSLVGILVSIIIITASTAIAQMSWNQAAFFPGSVGSHVTVPNSSTLNITNAFTLEAWVNPSSSSGIARGVISKGTGLSIKYAMRIVSNRLVVITNSAQRIISRASNPIPLNTWTHIAASLDASGTYRIFINGSQDTISFVAGSFPTSGTDSLYIGSTGSSTEFHGMIDDARVWNTALSALQVSLFTKSALGISGDGIFSNLVLSISFQNNTSVSPVFSAMDHSRSSNNGFIRNGVTAFNLSNRPSRIHQVSDCAYYPSAGAGFSSPDNTTNSPTNRLTVEMWVFPFADNYGLIYKGPGTVNADYGLRVISGKLNAVINGTSINSNDSVKKQRWSHVAFTYFGATGEYVFYVDGKKGTSGSITPANITDGADSLWLGLFPSSNTLTGYFDEVRISKTVKSAGEINSRMYMPMNESNDNDSYSNIAYNLDGSTLPSTFEGLRLNIRGTASFTFNGGFTFGLVQSPINYLASGSFHSGYYMKQVNKRLPLTGTTGTVRDTIEIIANESINDMNIYVALNHSAEQNIRLTLTSPLGASVEFFANTQLIDFTGNIITVFDSDADSTLINGRYLNFGPAIKPLFDLDAIFAGASSKGKWILAVSDDAGADTGFISAWGIQINNSTANPLRLECTSFIEGLYNSSTNQTIADTVTYYLRSGTSPYGIVDSAKAVPGATGTAFVSFNVAQSATGYFLALKHRNSLETWSSTLVTFTPLLNQATFNFSDQVTKAFGDNMRQIDSSPVRFGFYSGDTNRDGTIDAADVSMIDNAASNFVGGYVIADLTGDNFVDGTDFSIADNNAANFVSVIRP